MSDLNKLFKSEQAQKLMNDKRTLQDLNKAPETQRLMEIINSQSNENIEKMVSSATKGDTAQLMGTIQKLMNHPESKKLLESISKKLSL